VYIKITYTASDVGKTTTEYALDLWYLLKLITPKGILKELEKLIIANYKHDTNEQY